MLSEGSDRLLEVGLCWRSLGCYKHAPEGIMGPSPLLFAVIFLAPRDTFSFPPKYPVVSALLAEAQTAQNNHLFHKDGLWVQRGSRTKRNVWEWRGSSVAVPVEVPASILSTYMATHMLPNSSSTVSIKKAFEERTREGWKPHQFQLIPMGKVLISSPPLNAALRNEGCSM